jgi:hypothetical protein
MAGNFVCKSPSGIHSILGLMITSTVTAVALVLAISVASTNAITVRLLTQEVYKHIVRRVNLMH